MRRGALGRCGTHPGCPPESYSGARAERVPGGHQQRRRHTGRRGEGEEILTTGPGRVREADEGGAVADDGSRGQGYSGHGEPDCSAPEEEGVLGFVFCTSPFPPVPTTIVWFVCGLVLLSTHGSLLFVHLELQVLSTLY